MPDSMHRSENLVPTSAESWNSLVGIQVEKPDFNAGLDHEAHRIFLHKPAILVNTTSVTVPVGEISQAESDMVADVAMSIDLLIAELQEVKEKLLGEKEHYG